MSKAGIWTLEKPGARGASPPESAFISPDHGGHEGESVIGNDGRELADIGDLNEGGKYRAIVKIQSRFSGVDGKSVWMMGTGWLIQPDVLITAGHVVYDHSRRLNAAKEMRCYIGYNGRSSVKLPSVQLRFAQNVVTTAEWLDSNADRTKDVAFVKLTEPFTSSTPNGLRLFKYTETPESASAANIGVVGYPGDKSLPDEDNDEPEAGAQMYIQFQRTNYNLATSKRHMIEYPVSTFGGQSGGPVIRKGTQLVVIGTHCYGAGDTVTNSGNAIGGKFGNFYQSYIDLFNGPFSKTIGKIEVVTIGRHIETASTAVIHSGANILPVTNDVEGIFDILKTIGSGVSAIAPIAGSILGGPIGGAIGTVGGSLLGSILNAENIASRSPTESLSDETMAPGAVDRAILAEAALQTVAALSPSAESIEILQSMQKTYHQHCPHVDKLSDALAPYLTEPVIKLTLGGMNKTNGLQNGQPKSANVKKPLRPHQTHYAQESQITSKNDFIEALLDDTAPLHSEEGFFDDLGNLLSKAVTVAKPLLSGVAKDAITTYGPRLVNSILDRASSTEAEFVNTTGKLNTEASAYILKRAFLADASLQALMSLDKKKLNKLQLRPGATSNSHEEGIFDFMKGVVQTIGPVALGVGKAAVKKLGPMLLNTVAKKISGSENTKLHVNGFSNYKDMHFSEGTKRTAANILPPASYSTNGHVSLFSAVNHRSQNLESLLEERARQGPLPERRRSLDSNDDLPPEFTDAPPLPPTWKMQNS